MSVGGVGGIFRDWGSWMWGRFVQGRGCPRREFFLFLLVMIGGGGGNAVWVLADWGGVVG